MVLTNKVERILFTVTKFFGMLPLNHRNEHSISWTDYIFVVLNLGLYMFCLVTVLLYQDQILQVEGCKHICYVGNMTFVCLGIFMYSFCFISSLKKQKFFSHFYQELEDFDERFSKCDVLKNITLRRDYVKIIMSFVMIGGFLAAFGYNAYEFLCHSRDIKYFILSSIAGLYPFITSSLMQLVFTSLIHEIGNRFEKINYLFKVINKECNYKNGPIKIFDIELNTKSSNTNSSVNISSKDSKDIKKSADINNKQKDNEKETEKNTELDSDDDDFDYDSDDIDYDPATHPEGLNCERNMVELFTIHEKLSTLGVETNKEYATAVVAFMTATFVISIFGIFLATKVLFTVGGKNVFFDHMTISFVIWTLSLLVVAYLVLRLCCRSQVEARKTALLIHEIMQKKPAFMLGNDDYYNKMKCFTLQYLHWEQYFQFNGVGLFSLDYTFIFSAVSAATSYLIVLLQFDMTTVIDS